MSKINNEMEYEIFILTSVFYLLDDLLNQGLFSIYGTGTSQNIGFTDNTARKFFFLLLVDLLSPVSGSYNYLRLSRENKRLLNVLIRVTEDVKLGCKTNMKIINRKARKIDKWVNKKFVIKKYWSPSVEEEFDLSITRYDMLYIAGNINKHSIPRLDVVTSMIKKVYEDSGVNITNIQAVKCIEDIYEWMHEDIMIYHSSYIVEMLLDLWHSIYDYFKPIYKKRLRYLPPQGHYRPYEYLIPDEVGNEMIHTLLWDMLNKVRGQRTMPKVRTTRDLRKRY